MKKQHYFLILFLAICVSIIMFSIVWNPSDREVELPIEEAETISQAHFKKEVDSSLTAITPDENANVYNSYNALSRLLQNNMPLSDAERIVFSGSNVLSMIQHLEMINVDEDLRSYLTTTLKLTCIAFEQGAEQMANSVYEFAQHSMLRVQCSDASFAQSFAHLKELDKEHNESYSSLLFGQKGVDLANLTPASLKDTPQDRLDYYSQLPSESIKDKSSINFYESLARIDSTANLNAVVWTFSSFAFPRDMASVHERKEHSAWLITSCASGYPCDDSNLMLSNFTSYCAQALIDCRGKSLQDFVEEYVPEVEYQEVLNRSHQIAQDIVDGNGLKLIIDYAAASNLSNN